MPAPSPAFISGLNEVVELYDALLCDVWGVIHNGVGCFPEACEALVRFQETRGPVLLISNSPRPAHDVLPQLRALSVPNGAFSGLITSGDVTRQLLSERTPGRAWAIGPERDYVLYEGLQLSFTGPEDADFISCTGPVNDDIETPEDYREQLARAAHRNLVMICANPDIRVQRGERLIYCGGALAALYETLGGTVIMAGKPYAPIYAATLKAAESLTGDNKFPPRCLAIGDGLHTDVLGANRAGLDCLFVSGGVHAADAVDAGGRLDPKRLAASLERHQLNAAYVLAALRW